jgi:2-iminobutanoate/2-iminopropanoate deaminase
MEKKIVSTDDAPKPVGPYSQAISVGDLVFTAGQLPIVPATKQMAGPDIAVQTRQALENIKAILEAAGSCLDHVVKCTVFLSDMSQFARMNEVYAEYFANSSPARSTVPIGPLPGGAQVEIEATAIRCDCSSAKSHD